MRTTDRALEAFGGGALEASGSGALEALGGALAGGPLPRDSK